MKVWQKLVEVVFRLTLDEVAMVSPFKNLDCQSFSDRSFSAFLAELMNLVVRAWFFMPAYMYDLLLSVGDGCLCFTVHLSSVCVQ